MKNLTLIFCLFFLCNFNSKGQKVTSKNDFYGLYFGGNVYSAELNAHGYYYFNKDSTFIFLRTSKKNISEPTKDTLEGYGKGTWHIKDSFFIIVFVNVDDLNIYNDAAEYHSFSMPPYDSLKLDVHIKNKSTQSPIVAAIILKEGKRFNTTDSLGHLNWKLPLTEKANKLMVTSPGFYDKEIALDIHNNIYVLNLELVPNDKASIAVVKAADFPYKIYVKPNGKIIRGLKKEDGGVEKLMQIIQDSYNILPQQKFFLDKILKELKLLK